MFVWLPQHANPIFFMFGVQGEFGRKSVRPLLTLKKTNLVKFVMVAGMEPVKLLP